MTVFCGVRLLASFALILKASHFSRSHSVTGKVCVSTEFIPILILEQIDSQDPLLFG